MGYVLDLSDRTIRAFFGEMDIDIDAAIYQINGTSKGNRVRTCSGTRTMQRQPPS